MIPTQGSLILMQQKLTRDQTTFTRDLHLDLSKTASWEEVALSGLIERSWAGDLVEWRGIYPTSMYT